MPVKGGYLALAGGGAILLWSGIRGKSWSAVLRDVISGKPPGEAPEINSLQSASAPSQSTLQARQALTGNTPGPQTYTTAQNQAVAKKACVAFGWSTGDQWNALVRLWDQESGWSNTARNPQSGAYGIPQALPESKMPFLAQSAGGSHALPQIMWGLLYIKARYGSPVNAWAHEQQFNWY